MKLCHIKIFGYILLIITGSVYPLGSFLLSGNNAFVSAEEHLPTSVEVQLSCGDGFAEPGVETCDPGQPPAIPADVGSSTCQEYEDIFGDPFHSGDLSCRSDCSDYATSTCYTCGNGNKEDPEQCDNGDFGNQDCTTFGLVNGSLRCTPVCLISLSDCESAPKPGQGNPAGGSSGGSSGGTTGYQPGSEQAVVTKVIVSGKSYPNSQVHVLLDGKVVGIAAADTKADFYFETNEVTPGVASFGFWSEDKDGLKSTLLTLTVRIISGAVTTISGVYLSPSISVDKQAVDVGEPITIFGQTAPDTEVHIHVNSDNEFVETTDSKDNGDWSYIFDTSELEEDYHTAKALFQMEVEGNVIKSGYSPAISFYVGQEVPQETCPGADLNADGLVNLTDFSILLFWWGKNNTCADQDHDGTVNLIDFSIMMYHWTG